MYPAQLVDIVSTAVTRLQTDLKESAPVLGQQTSQWMQHLAGPARSPADYFMHPLAFPSLLLPWWAEQHLRETPNLALQANLVYSTLSGYYYIRLIDNLMDGEATAETALLPALALFHTQFQTTYRPYFAPGHPFWNLFEQTWFHTAEVTFKDTRLTDITAPQFEQIAAQKTCAAKIPVAAICYIYQQPHQLEPWAKFIDRFGCWHQFFNDLFDWHKDLSRQTTTYFLSEARRRKKADEPVAGWVAREGFAWGITRLQNWMSALKKEAQTLSNPDLQTYLDTRQALLLKQQADVSQALPALAKIAALAKPETT